MRQPRNASFDSPWGGWGWGWGWGGRDTAALKKHFFRWTKIPYPDKSRLFDRGFPGRAVYFTYKVTRWITRALFFARLPGITFLNGFYVLNSNGVRFSRIPLRTLRALCHPSDRYVTNYLCLAPSYPSRHPSLPSLVTPTPALGVSRQVFRGGHDIVVSDGAPASFARLSPELRGQEL